MEVSAATIGGGRNDAATLTALRRLAMMIARGESYEVVVRAVTVEAVRQFGASAAAVIKYELDGMTTTVADGSGAGPSGLIGLRDRIEALGGTFSVDSPLGAGTTVSCRLPVTTVAS